MPTALKIETPDNIDRIFSLECFKFNDMKGLFHIIFEYMTTMGSQINDINQKVDSMPDFSKLTIDMSKLQAMVEKFKYKHEQLEIKVEDMDKNYQESINNISDELDTNK